MKPHAAETLPEPARRVRRTAEEARRLILDAAEATLGREGPAGLRLTQVAARAGVSHPTVLHHFGNREGLLRALNQRAVAALRTRVVAMMQRADPTSEGSIPQVFRAYREGLAERLVWLHMNQGLESDVGRMPLYEEIVAELHALRLRIAAPGVEVREFDSRAIIHLTTMAAFGDAVIGHRLRQSPDAAAEATARTEFETWFGDLLDSYIGALARGRG